MRKQFQIFRDNNFTKYVLGRFFFISSLSMQATIITWEIYRLTNDALSLGLLGLIEFIPALITAFFSGHIIDTRNKKSVLLMSIFSYFICSILLLSVFVYNQNNILDDNYTTYLIYSIVFLTGIFRTFTGPGFFSFLAEIVKKEKYVLASNWHTNAWQIASVLGPAMGGILYAYFGIIVAISAVCAFLLSSQIIIYTIKHKPIKVIAQKTKFLKNVFLGFAYIIRKKVILHLLLLDLLTVLFAGATALLPIFSKNILQVGAIGLGMLRSSISAGSIIMILILTLFPMKKLQGQKMLFAMLSFGVCMLIFGISTNFYLSLTMLFLSGVFDSVGVIVRSNVLQVMVPQRFKGRVTAVNTIFIMSSNELGALESGVTAKYLGAVRSVIIGGTISISLALRMWFKSKEIKNLSY